MWVKICGLTRPVDVEAAAEAGADAIGLVFAPGSSRRVSEREAAELVDVARSATGGGRPLTIGVFREMSVDEVAAAAAASGVDGVQYYAPPEEIIEVARREVAPKMLIWGVAGSRRGYRGDAERGAARSCVDAVLVDGARPGSGEAHDWSGAADEAGARRLIIAGGLTPDNVADAIGVAAPWGVDVSSGVESSPGVKDPNLIRAFVEAARMP